MHHVLITRPQDGAMRTAERLSEQGFFVHVLPFIQMRTLLLKDKNNSTIAGLQNSNLIATSSASFNYLEPGFITQNAQNKLFCVGSKTAEAAFKLGFKGLCKIYNNVNDLIEKQEFDSPIVYLAGKRRRSELEEYLSKMGYNYRIIEAYDAVARQHILQQIKQSNINLRYIQFTVVTSAYIADLLNSLASFLAKDIRIICFSLRIASKLSRKFFSNIYVADYPHEDSALELLQKLHHSNL